MFSSVLFCCTVLVLATEATQVKEVERDLNTEKTARNFRTLSPEERRRDLENEDYIDLDGWIVVPYSVRTERNFWRSSPQDRKRDLERETERSPFDITNI